MKSFEVHIRLTESVNSYIDFPDYNEKIKAGFYFALTSNSFEANIRLTELINSYHAVPNLKRILRHTIQYNYPDLFEAYMRFSSYSFIDFYRCLINRDEIGMIILNNIKDVFSLFRNSDLLTYTNLEEHFVQRLKTLYRREDKNKLEIFLSNYGGPDSILEVFPSALSFLESVGCVINIEI